MKFYLLQLAALGTAFWLPNEQASRLRHLGVRSSSQKPKLMNELESNLGHISNKVEYTLKHASEKINHRLGEYSAESRLVLDDASRSLEHVLEEVKEIYDEHSLKPNGFVDDALTYVEESAAKSNLNDAFYNAQDFIGFAAAKVENLNLQESLGKNSDYRHHKPNLTLYQLISASKHTTKLAKLINEFDDLIEALNGTAANFTVFAPIDSAFVKLPKHHKPSKDVLKSILKYHVSPELYPAGRILVSRTIPTQLFSSSLGTEPLPQRLSTNIGLRGLTVNTVSRVVAIDIFGTNGVIHGVDSVIFPPPTAMELVEADPGDLSTLQLGLIKTGLFDLLKTTDHAGGTLFAPANIAFQKLGYRINAFLFSAYGLKYLKALLQYHVVPGRTLYSDAYYESSSTEATDIPKGIFHVDLATLLEDRSLSVDIARYGRLIEIKINAFARVATADFIAKDGVVHLLNDVLIPPKKLANGEMDMWTGEREITEEELKERLEQFIEPHSSGLREL